MEDNRTYTVTLHPIVAWILNTLKEPVLREEFLRRAQTFFVRTSQLKPTDIEHALAAHSWLLTEASIRGVALTSAGYLRPSEVKALADILPAMREWHFPASTEVHTFPVKDFHSYMRSTGLLRKQKQLLLTTKRGKQALTSPEELWRSIADTLIPARKSFLQIATVVMLVFVGSEQKYSFDHSTVLKILSSLGWRQGNGKPLEPDDLWEASELIRGALDNVEQMDSRQKMDQKVQDEYPYDELCLNAQMLIRDALFTLSLDGSGEFD